MIESTPPALMFLVVGIMSVATSGLIIRGIRALVHRQKREPQTVTGQTYSVRGIHWSQMMTEMDFQQQHRGNITPLGTDSLPAFKFPAEWFVIPNSVVQLAGQGMRAIQIKCPTRNGNTELVRLVYKI